MFRSVLFPFAILPVLRVFLAVIFIDILFAAFSGPTALVPTALVLVLTASSLEGAFGLDGVGFVLFCSAPKELLCLALLFRCSRRWFWC